MLLGMSESCLLLLPMSLMIQREAKFDQPFGAQPLQQHYTRAALASVKQPCMLGTFVTGEALLLACLQSCSSCIRISTNWFTCHSAMWCEKCAKHEHTQQFTSTQTAALCVHLCWCGDNRTILRDAHTCLLVVLHRRASWFCACILQDTHRCHVQGLH